MCMAHGMVHAPHLGRGRVGGRVNSANLLGLKCDGEEPRPAPQVPLDPPNDRGWPTFPHVVCGLFLHLLLHLLVLFAHELSTGSNSAGVSASSQCTNWFYWHSSLVLSPIALSRCRFSSPGCRWHRFPSVFTSLCEDQHRGCGRPTRVWSPNTGCGRPK
jgi:hypothetical protein